MSIRLATRGKFGGVQSGSMATFGKFGYFVGAVRILFQRILRQIFKKDNEYRVFTFDNAIREFIFDNEYRIVEFDNIHRVFIKDDKRRNIT